MTCFKSEFEFQSALIKQLKQLWAYVRNIADIWRVQKPFDISMNFLWKWWALELKIWKLKSRPKPDQMIKKLYPHQIANLIEFSWWKSQGISLVIAYDATHNEVIIYEIYPVKDKVVLHELKSFEWETWCAQKILDLFF